MKTKIQNLKGFRDFLPGEKRKRDYVLEKVKETFKLFGFEPLETPTLEYAELLMGKYGVEADKLVYNFEDRGGRQVALKYDQTVPTARILTQYQDKLPKYFRRFQIQNVFRADKPQKGRFREFTQCDIDIFGSTEPLSDAEILACTYFACKNVGFASIRLKINDRQVLIETLKPFITSDVDVFSIIQTIDKLDKLPEEKVAAELVEKGLAQETAQNSLKSIKTAKISESLAAIIATAQKLGVPAKALVFEPALARGLDYYTGMIFEVIVPEYGVGSLGGGGRYDNLIKQLGGVDVPAVGIGLGFDRMVEAAWELDLIPKDTDQTQVLVTVFTPSTLENSLEVARVLREQGIATEIYMDMQTSIGKQCQYADSKNIPYALIIGAEEAEQGIVALKNLKTREQKELPLEEAIKLLQ
jgi:histidyl-tRNA synthetase